MSAAHRMMVHTVLALATTAVVTGCSTHKNFYATGGSRADGTVDMAYDFRAFETPVVSQQQAASIAKSKCSVWGYSDAEAFGGMTQICHQRNGYGTCLAGQVVIKYQCLGNLNSVEPARLETVSNTGSANAVVSKDIQLQQLKQSLIENKISYDEYRTRHQIITGQ